MHIDYECTRAISTVTATDCLAELDAGVEPLLNLFEFSSAPVCRGEAREKVNLVAYLNHNLI